MSIVPGETVTYAALPALSADGSTVVFSATTESGNHLYARNRATGTTALVDVAPDGSPLAWGDGISDFDVSADGRFVVFASNGPVAGLPTACSASEDEPCYQVFRRDLVAEVTDLVSIGLDGLPTPLGAGMPSVSGDGSRVAFVTALYNQPENAARRTVYLRDLVAGTTEQVSVSTDGTPEDGESFDADLSDGGTTVAFSSSSTNLGGDATPDGGADVFVRDLVTRTTAPAVPAGQPVLEPGESFGPSISADGDLVAFMTQARLDPADTDGSWSTYLVRRGSGSVTLPFGSTRTDRPQLSADGRFLAVRGFDPGVPLGRVLVQDLVTEQTSNEAVRSDGTSLDDPADSGFHSISGDGRFVAFTTRAADLGEPVPGALDQVYVHDRAAPGDSSTGAGAASTATASGPTLLDTIQSSVSGSPGAVTIEELPSDRTGPVPAGYALLGQQVEVTAQPPAPPGYLVLTFDLDVSAVPADSTPADVDLFRNGVALGACAGADDPGPCVAVREVLPSGDWRLVAHAPEASLWQVAVSVLPPDTTAPNVTVTQPVDGAAYTLGESVTAWYSCDDGAGSGVAFCTGSVPSGSAVDTTTSVGLWFFQVDAQDNAGNSARRVVTYRVVWPWSGFLGPVDDQPVVNVAKAGSIVPVTFSLGGDRGLSVFAPESPQLVPSACTAAPRDAVERTLRSGTPALTYSAATERYTYAMTTSRAWRGTCAELHLTFTDGEERVALFRFR